MKEEADPSVLPMRRLGRQDEKLFHFHRWKFIEEAEGELVFRCVREEPVCGDEFRIKKPEPAKQQEEEKPV